MNRDHQHVFLWRDFDHHGSQQWRNPQIKWSVDFLSNQTLLPVLTRFARGYILKPNGYRLCFIDDLLWMLVATNESSAQTFMPTHEHVESLLQCPHVQLAPQPHRSGNVV